MSNLDLGTLTVKMAADIGQLKADFAKAQAETAKTAKAAETLSAKFSQAAKMAFGAFDGIGGKIAGVSERMNKVGEAIGRVFNDNATPAAKKLGAALEKITGLSGDQFKGMAEGIKATTAALQVAAVAAGALSMPLLAAIAAAAGLVLAAGAIKKAFKESGGAAQEAGDGWLTKLKKGAQRYGELYAKDKKGQLAPDEQAELWNLEDSVPAPVRWQTKMNHAVGNTVVSAGGAAADGIKDSWAEVGAPMMDELKKLFTSLIPEASKPGTKAAADKPGGTPSEMKDRIARVRELAMEEQRQALAARDYAEALRIANAELGRATTAAEGIAYAMPEFSESIESIQRSRRWATYSATGDLAGDAKARLEQGPAGAVMKGFEEGGVIGALVGLLKSSAGFAKLLDGLNGVFQSVADAAGSIFEAAQPLLDSLAPLLQVVAQIGELVQKLVGPVLIVVAKILKEVFGVVAQIWNSIISAIQAILYAIVWALEAILPDDWVSGFRRWVDGFNDLKIDLNSKAVDENTAAQTRAAQAAERFSESLTNMPAFYKLASARSSVAALDTWSSGAAIPYAKQSAGGAAYVGADTGDGGGGAGGGGGSGRPTVMRAYSGVTINVVGGDPTATAHEVKRILEREAFVGTGSIVGSAPAYVAR